MCGIVGVLGAIDKETLQVMTSTLVHRGPDGGGYYLDSGVGLGHRRLSIIDLEGGKQPMQTKDGRYIITFNGEIYNFNEIKIDLESKGHSFSTHSDTEVILYAYKEYGVKCLKYLNGMFSFALYDTKEKTLFLARDRVGIKPLYYYSSEGLFVFASEIKAILEYPGIERVVNKKAVYEYFSRQYTSAPDTIFQNIYALEPGHFLLVNKTGVVDQRYWNLTYGSEAITESGAIATLKTILEKSVERQLIADVPLGAFLSGGIDSSIVVALMHRLKGEGIKTFSVGFEEENYDERFYSRLVAETYNTDHQEIIVTSKMMNLMDTVAYHLDEPLADFAALPTLVLSEFAKKKVKVVLTGEGGDENFAGYSYYRDFLRLHRYGKVIPSFIASGRIQEMVSNLNRTYGMLLTASQSKQDLFERKLFGLSDGSHLFKEEYELYRPELINKLITPYFTGSGNFLNEMLNWDTKLWLPNDLLMKVDKMTMVHGLEARVPYLDHEVLEFSAQLPTSLKLREGGKYILKKAFAQELPLDIIKRKKSGFDLPVKEWFNSDYRGKIDSLIAVNQKLIGTFFDLGKVRRMMRYNRNDLFLWRLYNFILWRNQYFQ